jgi:hypothetical protein
MRVMQHNPPTHMHSSQHTHAQVALQQNKALLGDRGILPVRAYMDRVEAAVVLEGEEGGWVVL